jgi:hypothetical protein
VPAGVGRYHGAVDQGSLVRAEPDDQLGDLGGSMSRPLGFARSVCCQTSGRVTAWARSVMPVRMLPGAIASTRTLRLT